MPRFKTVKLIFYLTTLLVAAKPFIGFSLYGRMKSGPPTIFYKIFSKRTKVNNTADFEAAVKRLGQPLSDFLLRFSFLLALLFPFAFISRKLLTACYLQQLRSSLLPQRLSLFTGQLLI